MSQADTTPPHKRRLWPRALALVGVLLIAGVAAVVVFRQEIATRAARDWLEDQGLAVRGLSVTRLTLDRVEVSDLALGAGDELAAAKIAALATWDGPNVTLSEVRIEGLRVNLDVTGEAPLLGNLQPFVDRLMAADDTPAAGPPSLPALHLHDTRLLLATPAGAMTTALDGAVIPTRDGGLDADLKLAADNELGRLQASLTAYRTAAGDLTVDAAIEDGQLAWEDFQVGAFSGRLAAALPIDGPPRLDALFDLADLAYTPVDGPALRLASGRLEAKGQPAEADIVIAIEGAEERVALTVSARQQPASEGPWSTIKLQGEVRTAGGLARFLPRPAPAISQGTLVFEAAGEGNLLGETRSAGTWQSLPALSRDRRLSLQGDAVVADVALTDGTAGISAHLPLNLEVAEGSAAFTLREDAEVRVEKPSRERLQALGVPDDVQPLIASGLSLTLAAAGDLPFRLVTAAAWPPREAALAVAAEAASDQGLKLASKLEGEARLDDDLALAAFSGRLDARAEARRVAIEGREARNLRLGLPLTARYDAEGLTLSLARAGALRIGQFGGGAPLRLQDPLNFTVSHLTLETPPDGAGYSYRLTAGEDGADFELRLADADALPVEAGALGLRLDGSFDSKRGHDADLEIRLAGLALPGYAFSAEAAEVDVALDRDLAPASSRFALGPLVVGGDASPAAPLRLDGKLTRQGKGYDIAAILALPGGARPVQPLADITARLNDAGTARLEAVSRFLTFDPDGLQPADLSPLLAELEQVRGSLTANAKFAWPPDPAAESGRVSLAGFSFESPAGSVSGLDLDLALTRLLPLASAPGQKLTIRNLDAAVPVEAIEIDFALDQEPQPHLTLARGGFVLGGARWRIDPTTLDPAAPRNDIVFATDTLDLATFFRLIEVEGLSGNGTLKGRLPIAFAGEDVIVEEGRFEALGPGKLQIRFEALSSALAGGGEYVELAAQALEDFHFEHLSLTLDKTAANDATLRLSTLGANPAVLDGQPFQFNINLESNLTSVLAALKQGYSLSDDALKRAWRLRE